MTPKMTVWMLSGSGYKDADSGDMSAAEECSGAAAALSLSWSLPRRAKVCGNHIGILSWGIGEAMECEEHGEGAGNVDIFLIFLFLILNDDCA